jgi:cysteine desulfurase family protein (TIGR01976 family)
MPAWTDAPALDLDAVRKHFPALATPWALLDNAGGSVACAQVIEHARDGMTRLGVQLGASYPHSVEARTRVQAGVAAMATLLAARPEDVVVGPSTTMNLYVLGHALRDTLAAGDEVVVSQLDHEANRGAWGRWAAAGVRVRTWPLEPASATLTIAGLLPLLGPRTRWVAFSHCPNVTGAIHDVAAITQAIRSHAPHVRVAVDGVAFAPHARVDVHALGVDAYVFSAYKLFGPHLGVMWLRDEVLASARNQNHDFIGEAGGAYKLQPGNVNHELTAALRGITEYFDALHDHHYPALASDADPAGRLERTFAAIRRHEALLAERVLAYLRERRDVRVLGPTSAAAGERAPTIAFVVPGHASEALVAAVQRHDVAIRWGHFYAPRALAGLGIDPEVGVVRASFAHYNTLHEADRLLAALDAALPRRG